MEEKITYLKINGTLLGNLKQGDLEKLMNYD